MPGIIEIPGLGQPSGVTRKIARNAHATQAAKYAKSGLSDEQLSDYKQRLEHIMRAEQAYLRSDLTLPNLASVID